MNRDPLEVVMGMDRRWLWVGRLGSFQVLVSRPDSRRWIFIWDLPRSGYRICALAEVVGQELELVGSNGGQRIAEYDPLPSLMRESGGGR